MRSKLLILVFFFLCPFLMAQSDYRVISSNSSTLVIEYLPEYLDTLEVTTQNQSFTKVILASSDFVDGIIGMPELPVRSLAIGVPSEFNNSIQILKSEYSTLSGKLSPVASHKYIDGIASPQYIASNEYSNTNKVDLVTFGDYGVTRGLPIQTINIFPIQYNSAENQIKLYTRIVFQVNLVSDGLQKGILKDKDLANSVINFNSAKNWGRKKNILQKKSVETTVLSSGTWSRFTVDSESIYKIDRAKLSTYGIDASTVDPRTIKIYNNGGYLLDEKVTGDRSYDLVENAIMVVGEEDGSFDEGDYILFYGRGIGFWEFNSSKNNIARNTHWYSKENYYWITSGGETGKRMEKIQSSELPNAYLQTSTFAHIAHEDDNLNLMKSGRICVGDEFTTSAQSRNYMNTLNNHIAGSEINYKFQFVNYSGSSTRGSVRLMVSESGTSIFSEYLRGATSDYKKGELHSDSGVYDGVITDSRSNLKFLFQTSNSEINGYLDFFTIEYKCELKAVENQIILFSADTTSAIEYRLSEFSNTNIEIFDVTDYGNVKLISVPGNWKSGGEIKFFAEETTGDLSKYLVLNNSGMKIPSDGSSVSNSSIKDDLSGYENIIITTTDFTEEAERLSNYRANNAPYKTTSKVFYLNQIYNEFSGGLNDPVAIRDFIKFAYDNWNTQPEYVCLFGDGDYDYFNLEGYSLNFIPTFQTINSFDGLNSYPYDDFYARIDGTDDRVDIALGRLPLRTKDDASNIVDKIIYYEKEADRGLWRNTISLVADDGLTSEGNDGAIHTNQSERLSKSYVPEYFDRNKIYLAAYPQVITGAGRRKPSVNDAIVNCINSGTLILNYVGHGNPKIWAHEVVFDREVNIPLLDNDQYFFLTAATCDYGKFDDPELQSATEEMLFLKDRGMIGGFSASRPVYSSQNAALNETFYNYLFDRSDDAQPVAVGTAYFKTKATRSGTNDEKYQLFCDPALRLAEPNRFASIDSLNGQKPNVNIQIAALSNSSIKGSVLSAQSKFDPEFDGEAIVTVFDSQKLKELEEINYSMIEPGGVIYRGRVSVENGEFDTEFTVPKDISYENDQGKIVAYVYDDNIDGIGYTSEFIVGGTNNEAVNDGAGPEIEIFFDDLSFQNSYLVNPNFSLFVKLEDETGLNTTGTGVGHKLEGILNNDEANAIDFSNFFIGDLDAGGKSGKIDYKFSNLEPGDYTIKIKAWDVFNNVNIVESQFTVVNNDELSIQNVVNYPNPFTSNTTFTFQHNLTEPINVRVKVYTIAGRMIKEIENEGILEKFVKVPWDGRDENGDQIANGTYLYKVIVTSVDGGFSENILGKLAVIR